MSNAIADRIASDLGYARPHAVSLQVHMDQLKYGAMSEWIRTITNDIDPLIGSNRIGVTRDYLDERAAEVLIDLSKAIDGVSVTAPRAKELMHWMVDKMLLIGELWEPFKGNVMCMPNHIVAYKGNYARITGQKASSSGPVVNQLGLCHYARSATDEATVKEFMTQKVDTERKLIAVAPEFSSKMGRTEQECLSDLRQTGAVQSRKGQITVRADINMLPEYLQVYLLTNAWPGSETPLNWPCCQTWLIPTS